MVPRTVLTRSGPIPVKAVRPVNTIQLRTAVNNVNIVKGTRVNTARPKAVLSAVKGNKGNAGNPQQDLKDKGVIDSGCSRHMTGNKSYLTNYEEIDGGFVAFGGNSKRGKITRKGKIKTGKLDFEDVYFVKELKVNLFGVSQMCDKKNSVLFTDTECVVLSPDFKLTDESHVLLKVPRKDNMYSVDLKNVIPQGGLTCLFAKATPDESNLWHRRLGHVNFKTMNKLVRGNLVRGIDNLIDLKVKVIRCDNRTDFKNRVMNQFCEMKDIKREFSVAWNLQQNGVAEMKNKTLIEAARTMLADSKLPATFWAEAVNTTCYVQNRVLVVKPQNKTPYKLFLGRKPALSFMRPFGCPVTILNTIDHLGKFDGKADEGFFVGYSTNSKAFRVFNSRTRIVVENLHVQFSENTPNIAGSGPNWLFDIDALTNSMNYKPIVAGNQSNGNAGTKAYNDAGKAKMEIVPRKDYILLPMWPTDLIFTQNSKESPDAGFKPSGEEEKMNTKDPGNENEASRKDSEVPIIEEPKEDQRVNQELDASINSTNNIITASDGNITNNVNAVSSTFNVAVTEVNVVDPKTNIELPNDPNMPELEDIVYSDDDEDVGAEADMNNLDAFMHVSPILTTRIHKDHPVDQIIRDLNSTPQTRRMTKKLKEHGLFSSVQQRTYHKDFQNCLFACFLSQEKPKKTLVDLPNGKRAIGTKWVYRNKKDERGIVIKNKARLVAQGYTQEEGIDYDEVFAPVARTEAIRLFLAYASFKDFVVYQMNVKSAFLYGKIEEEDYFFQPPGFEDPDFPDRVYKVEKALYGLHQAPRAWYETLSTYLLDNGFQREKIDNTLFIRRFEKMMHKKFQMSCMGELTFSLGLQVKQKEDGIFISQGKYVTEILKKFGFTDVKTTSTPMETYKPLLKDVDGEDVDEHLYRSMIGSLVYLTSLRPDIILISWQCKKQNVVANSTTEAEYIAASNCYGQVLWIQNQLLDYGYNFIQTKIHIDNESTICIVKNPIFHLKTKHIEIRHHLIRDSNEKTLIQMIKIHTDQDVANLLTKAFDVSRFQYLIANIGMLNL
ncbi:putative ribonuclease H-like domain-containing protein [Tanacetum coccineum]